MGGEVTTIIIRVWILFQDGSCVLEQFPSLEAGPLANVLLSEGKPGKVGIEADSHF